MIVPNFMIIGAPSCGTTSLYHYINQHPQVFMCVPKEPHFFSYGGHSFNPVTIGGSTYSLSKIDCWESYLRLFEKVPRHIIAVGEASASYIYADQAPDRIKEKLPDVKLIAILRNPAERAFSNFTRCVRDGCEVTTDFSKALQLEQERIQAEWFPKWFYLTKGYYYQQLNRYFKLFGRDQIFVCLYDDLVNDTQSLLKDIFVFLGVEYSFTPDVAVRHNQSELVRSKRLERLSSRLFSQSFLPEGVKGKLVGFVKKINRLDLCMKEGIRRELLDAYSEDILKLEALIERDLSIWLETTNKSIG